MYYRDSATIMGFEILGGIFSSLAEGVFVVNKHVIEMCMKVQSWMVVPISNIILCAKKEFVVVYKII